MTTIYSGIRRSTQASSDQMRSSGDWSRGKRERNSTQPRISKLSQPHHILLSPRTHNKTQFCQWQHYITLSLTV